MTLFFSEIQKKLPLPIEEKRRLQKILGTILPKDIHPAALHRLLHVSYERLGPPVKWLKERGLFASCQKLLDNFGFLSEESLSLEEKENLQKNPYTLWPAKDVCFFNGDALTFFISDKELQKENYLWYILQKLSSQAKKDWCRWFKLNLPIRSERERTLMLYHYLAQLSLQDLNAESCLEIQPAKQPVFLDEVFPDDLVSSPMYWFYRDVLTFYGSLQEVEKKKTLLSPRAQALLPMFKKGKLAIMPAPPEFGERQRWLIVETRECSSSLIPNEYFSPFLLAEENKEMLF